MCPCLCRCPRPRRLQAIVFAGAAAQWSTNATVYSTAKAAEWDAAFRAHVGGEGIAWLALAASFALGLCAAVCAVRVPIAQYVRASAEAAFEAYSDAFGQTVKYGSCAFYPLSGTIELNDVRVSNPEQFQHLV